MGVQPEFHKIFLSFSPLGSELSFSAISLSSADGARCLVMGSKRFIREQQCELSLFLFRCCCFCLCFVLLWESVVQPRLISNSWSSGFPVLGLQVCSLSPSCVFDYPRLFHRSPNIQRLRQSTRLHLIKYSRTLLESRWVKTGDLDKTYFQTVLMIN